MKAVEKKERFTALQAKARVTNCADALEEWAGRFYKLPAGDTGSGTQRKDRKRLTVGSAKQEIAARPEHAPYPKGK